MVGPDGSEKQDVRGHKLGRDLQESRVIKPARHAAHKT